MLVILPPGYISGQLSRILSSSVGHDTGDVNSEFDDVGGLEMMELLTDAVATRHPQARRTTGVVTHETGRASVSAGSAAGYDRIITTLGQLACERHTGGWGVRELAEALEESRTSVNRALMALSDVGLAERTDAGNYRAGPRLRVLADRVLS